MSHIPVVFIHAHPDDEAIFTGGTMAMLAAAATPVVLLTLTSGELGTPEPGFEDLGARRRAETIEACQTLGVDDVRFCGWPDSGLYGENPDGLCRAPLDAVVSRIVAELEPLGPVAALVGYDDHGIYGHPDHLVVHHATHAAAEALGVRTVYEATVDREYLHFVETHVVVDAGLGERPIGRGLASTDLGSPTLEIDCAIDVHQVIDAKRAALAAHTSQLPADAPVFELGQANFAAVYGWEWYRRTGPATVIDDLA